MRSIDFKKKPADIRFIKEQKPKKKFNWDKFIYLSILFVTLFFVGKFIFYKYYFVSGEGQVLFETLDVQLYNDVQVQKINCSEGDSIKTGDTLFTYIDENKLSNNINNSINNTNWKDKEKLKLMEEVNLKEIEIAKLKQLLVELNKDKARVQKEVYLDVYTADKLNPYIKQITETELRTKTLEKEIEMLNKISGKIDSVFTVDTTLGINVNLQSQLGHNPLAESFLSPVDGIVSHIFKKNHETVLETEHVMSIHDPKSKVYIKVFFEQSDVRHLHKDDIVEVEFTDGEKTKGKIKRFYFDTYELPVNFKKSQDDFQGDIEVDIAPLDAQDEKLWRNSQKLEVVVRKKRFF